MNCCLDTQSLAICEFAFPSSNLCNFVLQNYPKAQECFVIRMYVQYVHVYCYNSTRSHVPTGGTYLFLLCFQSAALSYDMCRERLKAKNLMYVMQILQILEGFLKFLKCEHYTCHSNSWAVPIHLLSCSLPVLSYGPMRMRVASGPMYVYQFVQYVCTFVSGTMNIINIG